MYRIETKEHRTKGKKRIEFFKILIDSSNVVFPIFFILYIFPQWEHFMYSKQMNILTKKHS